MTNYPLSDYYRTPNSAGTSFGKYNWEFLEYDENNYGVHWRNR